MDILETNGTVNLIFEYFRRLKLTEIRFYRSQPLIMNRFLLVVVIVVCALELRAQQDPQYTQNMFNRLAVNPAYAGSHNAICGTLLAREQWLGFNDNPTTNVFSAHGRFKVMRGKYQMGAGLTLIQDDIGPITSLNVKGAIAYHHRINQGVLSIGLDLGIFNQSINADWISPEGDGTEDPDIPNGQAGALALDLGAGIYYYTKDLYVGISSTHLNQPEISDASSTVNGVQSSLTFEQVRHYYMMAGYNYELSAGSATLELQPSVFAKTDAVSTIVDINTNVLYNNLVWGGVSYRTGQNAVSLLTGVQFETLNFMPADLKPLKIGAAYDFSTGELSDHNDGSIEFLLSYCYKLKQKQKLQRYKSVRFL